MTKRLSRVHHVDGNLRKGIYMFWDDKVYVIDGCDLRELTIDLIEYDTGHQRRLDYFEVFQNREPDKEPIFANNLAELFQKIREAQQKSEDVGIVSEKGISKKLIEKAQRVIDTVEAVDRAIKVASEITQDDKKDKKKVNLTEVIKNCLARLPKPVCLTTYYAYLFRYEENNGVRARIALSYTTVRYHKTQKSPALLHLVDWMLEHFYFKKSRIRHKPRRILKRIRKILSHTGGLWIHPKKCSNGIPEDVITELQQLDRSFDFIARNPEKMALLSPVGEVSQSWFYERFAYLKQLYNQPDDHTRTAFLRLGHRTQVPLDQDYMDEWQASIYREHKGVREKLLDLWITFVFEGYARCFTGFWVHDGVPNLEVGLAALKHSIFEKDLRKLLGYQVQMPHGIHKSSSLDNPMMHDSDAYINFAKELSDKGKFPRMEFTFRPKGEPRYGGLLESAIGSFADAFHDSMDEMVVFFEESMTTNTNKQTQHIVDYITRKTYQTIDEYHHTRHSALGQCPIDAWNEAVNATRGFPKVPHLTDKVDRLFWVPMYGDRVLKDGQISLNAMHYVPLRIGEKKDELQEYNLQGEKNHFGIHFSPQNIGRIAVFNHGEWIDDMVALELLGPDGKTLRPVSKLERKIARTLARKDGESPREWRHFLEQNNQPSAEMQDAPRKPADTESHKAGATKTESNQLPPPDYWEDFQDSISDFIDSQED